MNKGNAVCAKDEDCALRITRARARALGSLGGISTSSRPSFKNEQKNVLGVNSKRAASDDNKTSVVATAHKRRAVLTDLTNICGKSYDKCISASKFEARGGYKKKKTKLAADVSREVSSTQEDIRAKLAEELSSITMVESRDTTVTVSLEEKDPPGPNMSNSIRERVVADPMISKLDSVKSDEILCSPNKDIDMIYEKLRTSDGLGIVDIDLESKDPQFWSLYAPDIYNNKHVTELERRPLTNYMDKLQQDITPSMRGILIDWLVEVSEEYNMVPDTLYLTVNLIDRFLSTSLIQKQRLQLLGVTCMLIASKYEEICAPRVEEFCFITDNTYTKAEVLKMESQVLNLLHFQLSVPTIQSFLRRFIHAAQSSYKVPCVELEFLANYLAELTLVDYNFLQFLPSLIAASAVLLARWTLNQSEHPWNPTVEHYTNYKVSELKTTVLALADLQINTEGCSLNAIREKYKQQKVRNVQTKGQTHVLSSADRRFNCTSQS